MILKGAEVREFSFALITLYAIQLNATFPECNVWDRVENDSQTSDVSNKINGDIIL